MSDIRLLVENLVLVKPPNNLMIKRDEKPRPKVLLIDEVDVFFSDGFFGSTYTAYASIKGKQVEALTDYIWEHRKEVLMIRAIKKTTEYKDCEALFREEYKTILEEAVK